MKREDFLDSNGVVQAIETEDKILGLFGKYRPLSNFHEADVEVDGYTYRWSEAAYMAEKTFSLDEKRALRCCFTAAGAKTLGQTVTLRSDWEEVKFEKMLKVLRCKFSQDEFCRDLLLSTGDKYIEETNWWGDDYWGKSTTNGKNNLGKILMQIRDELRHS